MQILGQRVLIFPLKEEEITKSGLILPTKTQKYPKGVIQMIGNKVQHLKVGDTVMYYPNVGASINYRGDDLLLLKEDTEIITRL